MKENYLLLLSVITTTFLGWNALSVLSARYAEKRLFFLEKLGLSYLFGIGTVTIEMFAMSFFKIEFTKLTILVPWIAIIAVRLLLKSPPVEKEEAERAHRRDKTFPGNMFLWLISLQVLYNFFRALVKPVESYDACAIYGLKAKIIYFAHSLGPDFFRKVANNFQGAHPDYPLLVPLAQSWVYTFLGGFNDILVKAIFPCFYLAFIFVFYAVIKRITNNRTLSLVFTFMLASVKQFSDYSTICNTDLVLGVYFGVCVLYLYQWFNNKKDKWFLAISLASSVFCVWTKNEGALLVLIVLFILGLNAVLGIKTAGFKETLPFFCYGFIALGFIFLWQLYKSRNGLVNENFNLSMISIGNFMAGLNKIPIVIYGYQKEIFGFKKWNLFWIMLLIIASSQFKNIFVKNIKYVVFIILLFAFGYTAMYIFSAVEINFFVRFTASRFLLHIFPVAVFLLALIASETTFKGNRGI